MSKRARIFATLSTFLVLGVLALLVARPAYASPVAELTINGSKSSPDSMTALEKAIKAVDGKNATVVIDLNQDLIGGPLELPAKCTTTINMRGHKIDRNLTKESSSGHAVLVKKNSRVTINGDGGNNTAFEFKGYGTNGSTSNKSVSGGGLITGGYSTNKSGGIHLLSGARLTLNNMVVGGNRAEQSGGSDGYGGGIWASGSDVTVSLNNTTVCWNYAYNDGGGIMESGNLFNLFMNNTKVSNNYAKRNGGGIAISGSKTTVSGDPNTVVDLNSCGKNYGGGVYVKNKDVSVSGFRVENNRARYGGGVATTDHSITLSSLAIKGNTATEQGGGVYIGDFTNLYAAASDSMGGCTITGNSTTSNSWGKGAGVYVVGSGRGWLVKAFSLEVGGKTIIKDNGRGSGNLVFGSTSVHPNFTLTGNSDVRMGYEKITEGAVQVTHDRLKGPNCIRYLTPENGGYHFTYNPSANMRKIFYVKDGKDNESKYGSTYGKRQEVGKISSAAAAPTASGKSYNGWPVTRGYVRFPSGVEETVDLATPFFYSDGYFFDNPENYNTHLATASMCMAMSGFYLNTGAHSEYTNKHASARQFMADIGCDDQAIYVNDFNVQKPGIDTIGVTIAHKELKNSDGKDSGQYLIPVAIRGSNYEAEWTSNVTLDKASNTSNAEASGFASAADKVYLEIRSYMDRYKIPLSKARFWVAGYSRAGATTNLVCKRLIDAWNTTVSDKPQVFGYPMEAPQGGTNNNCIDNKYLTIHNVINQADLVPLVAPSAMGFKRYGVDHYIPGTSAGTPRIVENDAVTRGGSGAPQRRHLYADNSPIYTNDAQYSNAGAITQLKAIDPNIVFDDYFATCSMDFVPSPNIFEKSTGKTTVYEEKFIKDFVNELQAAAISSRDVYANDLEPTFRTVMGMLFGMEPSKAKIFVDRASTTMNRFDMLVASWDDHSMFRIWYSLIGEWNKANAKKKKEYTDLFYKKLKETDALEVLTKEERAKFDAAWPKLLDFIMRVLDRDYNTKSYDTAKMMMLGTFGYNTSRIMANHLPEVTLAWLRTYDDYYTNERTSAVISNAPTVAAPSASVGTTSLTAGDQVNEVPGGKQTVTLDVTNVKGEAIYYKMSGAKTSANTCKNGYDIYRGGIDLGRASNNSEYIITAYAMSYGTKSSEVTYKIKANGTTHEVVVYNERDARSNGKAQTYEWVEGSSQTIEAKEGEAWQFDNWKVWDEKGTDVTDKVLGDQQRRKKSATFAMPKGGENGFSEDYKLTFLASYKWRRRPRKYPTHNFTVKIGDATEPFQVAENQTFTYDATNKIPAGKHFKEWKVTDQGGTDVTMFMRPGTRNSSTEDYVWGSKYKPNMSCEVPGNNQTVHQSNGRGQHTFAKGYGLTFEAVLENVVTVNEINIKGVGAAARYASTMATIEYKADANASPVHTLNQAVSWKCSQSTQKNDDTTVTTTTKYEAIINCPAVAGKPFAADDALSIKAQINNEYVEGNSDYTVTRNRKNDGTIQVTITKVESKTTGTPTYTYQVEAHACDKNDAGRNVLAQNSTELKTTQSFKADKDGVFRFYNGPSPSGGNWKFCGYEVAADSGLEKVNTNNPYDNTFKVVDKTKSLAINMLFVPEISEIEVTQFPQPATGEPLADKDDSWIDFAYTLPENSVFADAFAAQVKSLTWQPAPGEGQKAAADTAYTAELELECVDKDGKPYECAFAQGGVSVFTNAANPAFESAEFDSKTSKLTLHFNKTERDTKHQVTVIDYGTADTTDDAKPKTFMWDEGEAKSVTAKSYDDYAFSGWDISDSTGLVDVSKLGLTAEDLKQQTLAFVMPGKDVLGDDYQLFLTAGYVPKASSLRAVIAAPMEGGTLANNAIIKWRATEESEQRSATVPVAWTANVVSNSTENETWTFTASMRLDAASAAEFVSGGVTATAGPSDTEDYAAGTSATCTRNADGSITVNVTFPSTQTAARKEDVTIEAYDANTKTKFDPARDTTLSVAWDTNDAGEFELLPLAIEGATFVGWEVPSGSKVERVDDRDNTFKLQNAVAGDNCNVHALYAPEVSSVTIAGVGAPVGGQQLTALSDGNVTATLNFSDTTKALFGENTLPGGANTAARIKVTNLTWTPEATGGFADYETAYTAAAKVVAKRVKTVDGQEVEDGDWRFLYARGASVQANGASTTHLNEAVNMANLHFPQTGRDKYHQVKIVKSTYNTSGDEYVDSWLEGTTHTVVARGSDDKLFSGWTVVDGSGTDVAAKLGLSVDALKSETLRITMPAYTDGGDFTKDYSLTITATYVDKLGAITATVPRPSSEADQLPATATLSWGDGEGQSAEADIWWNYESKVEETGANKTVTESYTAVMQLDAQKAQLFASTVAVTGVAATTTGEPQVKENGSAWTWNPDGSATITVEFNPVVTNVEARKVVAQACDVNTADKTKLADTTDEELALFVDEENKAFAVYAPEVEGAEFAGWAVPDKVTQVDAPQPDPQSGTNVSEDGLTVGYFKFENDAPGGQAYTIKALYKPVVSAVQTKFAAPKASQEMATTGSASFTLQNDKFSPVGVSVSALSWSPEPELDGKAAYGKEYEATVTLAPAADKQFAYADDLLPDYGVPDYSDEDDAAMVEYAAEGSGTAADPAHTMYVSFYATEQAGLLSIIEPNPIVATNDKNNASALKALLPGQVDIEVLGSTVNKATIVWGDPVCDENGGKAYESFWHAEGTVTLLEGVNPPAGVEAKDLKVSALIYVSPADKLNLLDVKQPADVTDVAADCTTPELVKQQLPTTTTLTLDDGVQEDAEVEWDTPTCVVDGEGINESIWTVTGKVKTPLPSWIDNPAGENQVSLALSINVYVNPPDRTKEPADSPYATLDDGVFDLSQMIYLDTDDPDALIYYTTDTDAEIKDFVPYTRGTPIYLDRSTVDDESIMVIQAYATQEGKDASEVVSYLYMLDEAIDVPEGEEFVFNGEEQAGVWSNDNYSLLDPSSGARIDECGDAVATNVGTYTVRARIADKLQWQLGEPDEEGNVQTTKDDQTVTFKIVPASVKDCAVELARSAPYTERAATPRPKVTLGDYVAAEGRDYTLAYADNVAVGKARVTVTGKGNLRDSVTLEFEVDGGDRLPVSYAGHAQTYGDLPEARDGAVLGTTGEAKRLEAISAKVAGGTIEYRSHLQEVGWEREWSKDGELSGTTGQARRLEAVQMRLSARLAEAGYHVWYRVHSQTYGWQGWARDGAPAGTTGMGMRAEAVQVVVLRGDARPEGYDARRTAYRGLVEANAHVQRDGWLGYRSAGQVGTTGQAKRLEALWVKSGSLPSASVRYQSHLQQIGWEGEWRADGAVSGTTGQARRMEAVRVRLAGDGAAWLSIWYRVHSQTFGWSGWACDGRDAGTVGLAKRAEAVEFLVLSRGADPPGPTADACRTR